jgi:hypothetical protein
MRLFRSMKEDADGMPAIGPMLGVRPGNAAIPDVLAIHGTDVVLPDQGGMSVAPDDPMHLLKHRRPPSLGGIGQDPVWYIDSNDLGADLIFVKIAQRMVSLSRRGPWRCKISRMRWRAPVLGGNRTAVRTKARRQT